MRAVIEKTDGVYLQVSFGHDRAAMESDKPSPDTYGPAHGSGNSHLQPGELQKAWRGEKPGKPAPKK